MPGDHPAVRRRDGLVEAFGKRTGGAAGGRGHLERHRLAAIDADAEIRDRLPP